MDSRGDVEEDAGRRLEKAALRASARAALAALTPDARRRASGSIMRTCLEHLALDRPHAVFVYVSTPVEVDTHALIDALRAGGHQVLVPYLASRTVMEAVPFPGWSQLRTGVLGIASPPPAPPWIAPIAVAIVPGLAFALDGSRLGHGAGYYDRWLARHPGVRAIALAYEAQLQPTLPRARHDVLIPTVITERRLIGTGSPAEKF